MVTPVSSGTAAAADVPGAAAEAIEDGEAAVAARTPSEYTREPINEPSTLVGVPSPEALASAPRCTRATRLAAGAVAEEPKIALTAAVLLERRNKMFVAGTPEPTASGMDAVATALTNEDVQLASVVVAGWKQDDITALSRSFGNFDRVVALGWLLGDLLDLPWLERKQAHSFGLAAGKKAGKVEEEIKAMKKRASSRASKLKQGDLEARHALEAAAAAEQAALLQQAARLTLPTVEPRTAAVGTKRKRAASPEPEQDAPLTLAEACRAAAVAKAAAAHADEAVDANVALRDAAVARLERAERRREALGPEPDFDDWCGDVDDGLGDVDEQELRHGEEWAKVIQPWALADAAIVDAASDLEASIKALQDAMTASEEAVIASLLAAHAEQLAAHAERAAALKAFIEEVLEEKCDLEAEVKRLRAERSEARNDAMMGCMW